MRAAVWMCLSALFYTVSVTIVRYLSNTLPTFEIVFLRNFLGLVFMLPWIMRVGIGAMQTRRVGVHIVRGLFSAMNLWCLFGAVAFIPVADVAAITFLQPVVGSLLAIVLLHEPSSGRRWAAGAIGFVGAMIIIRPGFEAVNVGVLLTLGSVFAGSVVVIFVKHLSRTDSPDTIAVYLFVTQTLLALIPAATVWRTPTLAEFGWLLVLGYTAMLIQRCFNRAMVSADASVALPFNFTRLIWAALLGYLVFAELPEIWTWIGGALVFAASVYLTRRGTSP